MALQHVQSQYAASADMDDAQWGTPSPPASYHGRYDSEDAFDTIIQWLGWRMAAVHAPLRKT